MASNYFVRSNKKFHFLITPDELRTVLSDVHFVVDNTGVRGYTESDPSVFLNKYEELYKRLANGDKLIWEYDYAIINLSTGITRFLENIQYTPSTGLSIPGFIEPRADIEPFGFFMMKNGQLSTAFYIGQIAENTIGLRLCFPSKVEYEVTTDKHQAGIVMCDDLDDNKTYQEIVERIKAITKPLNLMIQNKKYRTAVRVSEQAKRDLASFYFCKSSGSAVMGQYGK